MPESTQQPKPGSTQISGPVAAAIVCALCRLGVVLGNIGIEAVVWGLPSAAIGLLVGAVSGSMKDPIRAVVGGALMSAGVFFVVMLPIAEFLGLFSENAGLSFMIATIPFALQMGVAGAIGGGAGVLARNYRGTPQSPPPHPVAAPPPQPSDTNPPADADPADADPSAAGR